MFSAGPAFTGVGVGVGASTLFSEASLLSNGAHLNYVCRLGKWIQRYVAFPAKDAETHKAPLHHSSSVFSAVFSDLGLSNYTAKQWRTALATTFSIMDTSFAQEQPPTFRSILNQCRNHNHMASPYGIQHLKTPSRSFSSMSHTAGKTRFLNPAQEAWRSQWPIFKRFASVYRLEEVANYETDNPKAQAKYLEAVLESDPQYVIRRFESGRYAINPDVRQVYLKAIEMTGQKPSLDQPLSFLQREKSLGSDLGSHGNPVHMAITKAKGGFFKDEFWGIVRMVVALVIATFIFVSLISSSIFNGFKNSTKQMQMRYQPDLGEKKYTFDDIQGIDEAKEEIQEVVEFLKDPEKFQRLGARLPMGVLLVGPPGTGKTLLAKAIAGEAKVPFFFVSGSEFDEMFVGVGASRVRKLFETARTHKPCVLFIDELDAIGGKRHSSPMHPYSRMTLNQLLVELDGYRELEGVIVIGATNFPQALDDALTRPGRFDNRITITMPDIRARHKILELHSKKIILDRSVDLEAIARATTGFSGADLANLVNQSALKASLMNRDAVTDEDMEYAMDKINMGRERKSAVIDPQDRHAVAYHEGGHAIMALYTPGAMPIYKATIIPRGPALGLVAQVPEKDTLLMSKKEMLASIDVCMGGRVAEELILGAENITTGASSDLEKATKFATQMVITYGMSEKIGPVKHELSECGEAVKKKIDEEIKRILEESYERASLLLKKHAVEHERLAKALLKYETLTLEEIKLVVNDKPLKQKL